MQEKKIGELIAEAREKKVFLKGNLLKLLK